MTTHRLTKTIALVLIALVAFSGVADAKRKKRKPVKKRPAAAAIQAPTTRSWVISAIVTVLGTGAFPGVTGDTIDPDGVLARRLDATPGAAYLLRPDHHVCARWRSFDRGKIAAARDRALGKS